MAIAAAGIMRRSLADQVADALVHLILDEGLHEGDALPSTADLSDRFGVSRTVVREALADLAGRGVVTRSQGRECVVATPGSDELSRLLEFRIRTDGVTPAHILDVRVALEVAAAGSAAEHATAAQKAGLREQLHLLRTARSEADYHAADIALHRGIAEASGNRLTVLILDGLVEFLRDLRVQATKNRRRRGDDLAEVIDLHQAIVDAIDAGDGPLAAAAMDAHLLQTREEFATPSRGRSRQRR